MYSFFSKIVIVLRDVQHIYDTRYKSPRRTRLFLNYVRIRAKAFTNRWFHWKSEHFLGYSVQFPDYDIFFVIFRQIFIRHTYYCVCNTPKPLIIDCGGNVGMSVLYFKYIYPDSSVIVFEPSREVIEHLRNNVSRNGLRSVEIINAAVSINDGVIMMHSRGAGASGNTISQDIISTYTAKPRTSDYEVPTKRLSSYIRERVDILKLDIEGAEGEVISELVKADALKKVEQIVMEYHYFPKESKNHLDLLIHNLSTQEFEIQFYPEDDTSSSLDLREYGSYVTQIHALNTKPIVS